MKRYTLSELQALPTLSTGHMEDLKVFIPRNLPGSHSIKVWLSRMTKEDGMPYDNEVIVEKFDGTCWRILDTYEAI